MISLQFARGSGIDSRAIEWFGGGPLFSHVDSVLPDGSLLGARLDGGVAIRPADYLGDEYVLRVDLPTDAAATLTYYELLRAELGKPYDSDGILGFVAGRNWRKPDAWFCSELVAAKLEQCGRLLRLASPSNKITPPDLVLVLSALVPIAMEDS